jgi:DNA-binding transcriptional LysR family regulator
MQKVHGFLSTTAFDLYELHLFYLVAKHGSFTRAASVAGITQSAITRQVQALEKTLSVSLFERTTRNVRLTSAGEFLLKEAARLLGDADQAIRRLREEFSDARKEVRVGVSRSISLAHLPGFFHANVRQAPEIAYRVSYSTSVAIMSALESSELDLGVISPPRRLPQTLQTTHRFTDAFTLIAPANLAEEFAALPNARRARDAWLMEQSWLTFDERTNTGASLQGWMRRHGWKAEAAMKLGDFDLIINLVALGMGVAFVPIRSLALYARKRNIARLRLPVRFERELVVLIRRHRNQPKHVTDFVSRVLF